MAGIRLVTYNVRGLNSPMKCASIMSELRSFKAEVIFLQETHLYLGRNQKIISKDYPLWIYSDSPIRGAKGGGDWFCKGSTFSARGEIN